MAAALAARDQINPFGEETEIDNLRNEYFGSQLKRLENSNINQGQQQQRNGLLNRLLGQEK